MNMIIFGASGMLGFALHRVMHDSGHNAYGVLRSVNAPDSKWCYGLKYITQVDVFDIDSIESIIARNNIEVIINAAALKKGCSEKKIIELLLVNSVFPRRLGLLANKLGVRLIHFSTDSVYGRGGAPYLDSETPKPEDLYSISKFTGEPESQHGLTLRLSIVGRTMNGSDNLVDWLLAQRGKVRGFTEAVFSGLPVNEVANIINEKILPKLNRLYGVYNLSGYSISKFELLELICKEWSLNHIKILRDSSIVLDRSLDSGRLCKLIEYTPKPWVQLMNEMRKFYEQIERNGVA